MNKTSIIIAALTLTQLLSCSGSAPTPKLRGMSRSSWLFEGWACRPDLERTERNRSPVQNCSDEQKREWLYMKFTVRASEKAIRKNDPDLKQTTCRKAAGFQMSADGLPKILGEFIEKSSGTTDISYGVAIVTQTRGLMRHVGLYGCCSLNENSGRCAAPKEPATWTECLCVGYMKYPGGEKSFESCKRNLDSDANVGHCPKKMNDNNR